MAKSIRKMLVTDADSERNGIWFEMGNVNVKLARAGGANQAFNKAASELAMKHQRALQANALEDDEARRIAVELYASTVVVKWQTEVPDFDGDEDDDANRWTDGVEVNDGEILPDTVENRVKFLLDVPEFFAEIKRVADNYGMYRRALAETTAKN